MKNSAIFYVYKGHNSRTVKATPPNFKHDLYYVVMSIVYKFYNIWLRQMKVREGKRIIHQFFQM